MIHRGNPPDSNIYGMEEILCKNFLEDLSLCLKQT